MDEENITKNYLLSPQLIEVMRKTDEEKDPTAVKISRSLFIDAQYSSQHLQRTNPTGKSFLFADSRAGVVIADRGPEGGSELRHIIQEHDRLRRVRAA